MNWYYESGGQQQGPVSEGELDRLLAEGKITLDTLVWRDGMAGWAPLRSARPGAGGVPPMPGAPGASGAAGWEVTKPGSDFGSGASATSGSDAPQPGWIRCTLTGRYFPPSEIIYLEGKPYSAAAKPQVIASMQSGVGLPTSEAGREGPAWEHRQQLGFFKAIVETVKAVLMEPTRTFSTMKREGGLQDPLIFNLIVGSVAGIIFQLMASALQIAMLGAAGGQQGMGTAMVGGAMGMVISVVMVPIQIVIGAFVWAGILHLCLMLLKAAPRPFETTFRAMNYASGGLAVLYLIPVIGWIALIPWGIVVTIIAIARAQEIPTGKAAFAVFLPMIVCCGFFLVIAVAAGAFGALNQ